MIRRSLSAAVVATTVACALPVLAGGDAVAQVPVRIKNVGAAAVRVNALSGSASLSTLLGSARTVAANGVSEFPVKAGPFTALAARPTNPTVINKVRGFETRVYKTIYLEAQTNASTSTIVGAPGGVKF